MNKPMNCQKFDGQLNAYLDNELDQMARQAMDVHAKACPSCGEQLDAMTRMLTMCAELDEGVQMPLEGQAAWRRAVRIEAANTRKKSGASGLLRGLSSVAAALVLLVGGTMAYRNMPNLSPATIQTNDYPTSVEWARDVGVTPWMAADGFVDQGGPVIDSDGAAEDAVDQTDIASGDGADASQEKRASVLPTPVGGFVPGVAEEHRKIIRSANRDIESTNFDADIQRIKDHVDEYGGQIPDCSVSGEKLQPDMAEGRYAWMNVRVPTTELDDFLSAIKAVGTTTSSSDYEQDVTSGYYDVENRLKSAQALLSKFQAMIPEATSLQDTLELEARIAGVQAEIESLTGSARDYDKQLDYSSVSISVREVADRNAVKPIDAGSLGERVKASFYDSINLFVEFAQDALVVLVLVWPWIVIGVLLLIVICAAARKRRSR